MPAPKIGKRKDAVIIDLQLAKRIASDYENGASIVSLKRKYHISNFYTIRQAIVDGGARVRERWEMGAWMEGERHPNWRGGISRDGQGYVRCKRNGKYVKEHRIVMATHIGRSLNRNEEVHHINGVRDDNRIENLELWSTSHPKGQRIDQLVSWAKEILEQYDSS